MPQYSRICPICDTPFTTSYKERQFFCSRKCYNASRKIKVIKTCEYCGDSFTCRNAQELKRNCCSHDCANKFRGRDGSRTMFTCEWCNKDFEEWTYRNPRFCSRQCTSEYGARQPKLKARHPDNWDGNKYLNDTRGDNWHTQRRLARKRDNKTCQICRYHHGKREQRRIIDVHHIIPYRKFKSDWKQANKLSNLITLCRTCHVQVESGQLPCPKRLL